MTRPPHPIVEHCAGGPPLPPEPGDGPSRDFHLGPPVITNYTVEPPAEQGGKPVRRGLHPRAVLDCLADLTDGWPRRVVDILFAPADGHRPVWLLSAESLFAWSASKIDGPACPIHWANGNGMTSKAEFFAFVRQQVTEYAALELAPHSPAMPNTYYLHPDVQGGDGKALGKLLDRFSPATPVDRELILALLMSLAWGGPGGSRPAFLVTGLDVDSRGGRGIGKSMVAKVASELFGGHVSLDAGDDIARIKTRLLTPESLSCRIALLDNVKTHKFSWGELEGLITDSVVSGHRMYVGDGRRPNTLTVVITLNGASLSKDMAQRVVTIKLSRPKYSPSWEEATFEFVRRNRWAIIGDLIARLEGPAAKLGAVGRWGAWERAVMSRVADPAACQKAIAEREAEVDEDQEESDRVRAAFESVIRDAGRDPSRESLAFDSMAATAIVARAKGERMSAGSASNYLKTIMATIAELGKSKLQGYQHWCWVGKHSTSSKYERVTFDSEAGRYKFEHPHSRLGE